MNINNYFFYFFILFNFFKSNAQLKTKIHPCPPAQAVVHDIKKLEARFTSPDYQRLFIGNTGNGKLTIAIEYANKSNAFFAQYHASQIVNEFRREGNIAFKQIFDQLVNQAKENKKDLVVLYISNIEELEYTKSEQQLNRDAAMLDHRAAFASFRSEWEQFHYNHLNNIKIFVIFGGQSLQTIHPSFADKLKGFIVPFANPDWEQRQQIFEFYLFEQDSTAMILSQLQQYPNKNDQAYLEVHKKITEVKQEEDAVTSLTNEFWKQYNINQKSWFTQQEYLDAKKIIIGKHKSIAQLADKKITDCISQNEKTTVENNLHRPLCEYLKMMRIRHTNLAFKYGNIELFLKLYHKTRDIYTCKNMEQIAKFLLQAAKNNNDGIITKEIFEKSINALKERDEFGELALGILAGNKGYNDMRREWSF